MPAKPNLPSHVMAVRHADLTENDRGFTRHNYINGSNSPVQILSMSTGTLAPGIKIAPHYHSYEEIVYLLKGQARMYYDDALTDFIDIAAGDFLYVPANIVHSPVNLGTEMVEFVIARSAPEENNLTK